MVGADIGTDHAYLPYLLLEKNICRRMLLCDVSPKSIGQARATVEKHNLQDRTRLILADGLDAVDEPCGCISMMGMGGETMAEILHRGQDRLQGAVLVLSAHTEQPLVRRALADIHYHLTQERLCLAAGRFYILWRAEPGDVPVSEEALRYGSLLFAEPPELLRPYLADRIKVLTARLLGLRSGTQTDADVLASVQRDLDFYQRKLEEMP